ncbi:MAG TPA: EVE domain-containing protein [Spongiibacteraceae bacterium]|nr:EVE domain-containing protein [Spongiibacteraceae bacterium]
MSGWLFKTEPEELSIEMLAKYGAKGAVWEGVRNYQARNMLRDEVKLDDHVFIYHSSCKLIGVAGVARVIKTAYPDPSQFDKHSVYFDAASTHEKPRWIAVDVVHEKTFKRVIPLAELRDNPALADLALVQRGNRLSVMPVNTAQWKAIAKME